MRAGGDDLVLPFRTITSRATGRLVRLGDTVDHILARHDYPDPVSHALGEALVLAALLGSGLKFESRLIVQTKTDGALDFLVADYVAPGKLRGYANFNKDDPRVANCRVVGGVFAREVMLNVVATQKMVEEKIKPLPPEQQEAALAEIAASVQAGMPPRENPRINTSLDSVHASGPLGRAHCVIHGNCNYKQTGLLQAYAAYSLLQQAPRKAGFASGCQAFGHRELLGVLRSFGLVLNPVVTVHS